VPIDDEVVGDLGGVDASQDGRELVPWSEEADDLGVHEGFLLCLVTDDGGSTQQVYEFVCECYVHLSWAEAGPQGDEAGGEVDFGDADVRCATADRDVRRVTEERVEELQQRRDVVHGGDMFGQVIGVTPVWARETEHSPKRSNF
jgi:hypothetical protein